MENERPAMRRETLPDGSIRLATEGCSFVYTRLRPGVLLTVVSGYDRGDLGYAALDEVAAEIGRFGAVRWFVDTREAFGVTTRVREDWTAWFQANQSALRGVDILVGSTFFAMAVSVAKLV